MEGKVPMKERHKRSKMLRILSEKKRRRFYEQNLGQERNVLFENDVENGIMHGFTENYIRVFARFDPLLINELKRVRLLSIADNGYVEVEDAKTEILTHH